MCVVKILKFNVHLLGHLPLLIFFSSKKKKNGYFLVFPIKAFKIHIPHFQTSNYQ